MTGEEEPVAVRIAPMLPEDVPLVFPLLQLYDPELTRRAWSRRGMRLARTGFPEKNGVILARYAEWPGPCGAAFYQVKGANMRGKRFLSVEILAAAMPGLEWPVMRALARASVRLGDNFGCDETRCHIATDSPALISRFSEDGFTDSVILLHKNLTSRELAKN
ncbi:hypothetical protein [Acetobacter oeni]|uniref:N-acetyltransferase domain-containing protein n=1 Tax=Acetobacter oeni TaxID=304077 RepID=A0A511XLC7_9PROT|nr:hypothetical protein [Acetobacter oeni]MBB3883530.1 hypothetical protein [Acetobacter oeni]NHO19569.1 hypothetical protein [Acetobacter oeni]GEN63751.1 hypothetical protein AOE01nite_19750 [Acetobacter oeni]